MKFAALQNRFLPNPFRSRQPYVKMMRKCRGFFSWWMGEWSTSQSQKRLLIWGAHYPFKGLPTYIGTFSKRLEEHYNTQPPTTSLLHKPHKNILIGNIKLQKVWPFVAYDQLWNWDTLCPKYQIRKVIQHPNGLISSVFVNMHLSFPGASTYTNVWCDGRNFDEIVPFTV